ncbi:MAG TPA: YCF48-related protein [Flavobacterium sp.]|jgi:photosystem II stability/assembly factor-like uncharacterized protein
MIKIYLLVLFFSTTICANSQCGDYTQLLTSGLNNIEFFDVNTGVAFGHGTMIRTIDGGATWHFVKIPTGLLSEGISDFAIVDDNSAILVGDESTFLKTDDKGQTWRAIPIHIDNIEKNISIDFVSELVGYMTGVSIIPGTFNGPHHLLKTTDGGETWTQIFTSFNNTYFDNTERLKVNFVNELLGFAWTGWHLLKTVDGGATWITLTSPVQFNDIHNIEHSADGTIIAMVEYNLYKSTDSGSTWSQISQISTTNGIINTTFSYDIFENTIALVAAVGSTSTRSFITFDLTNNVLTSHLINAELRNQSDVLLLDANNAFIIDNGSSMWAGSPGRKILKSTTAGATWFELDSFSLLTPDGSNNIKLLQNSQNTYTMSKQDNYTPSDFYLYTSTNNGASWQQKVKQVDQDNILLRADGNYISYLASDNFNGITTYTLYESESLGATWAETTFVNPYQVGSYYDQIDENTLVFGFTNEISVSFDKGQNWTQVPLPNVPNVYFNTVKYRSATEIYAWGQVENWPTDYSYNLYKTADLGQTWQQVVTIPDNNGVDLGATASTTIFGDDYALVSTGANMYFLIDLLQNTYTPHPFTNPNPEMVYLNPDTVKIFADDLWVTTEYLFGISTDMGLTWNTRQCYICGPNVIYNEVSEELTTFHSADGAERFEAYIPTAPSILGDTNVQLGSPIDYFVTYNPLANTEWILVSGGTIIADENENDKVTISWNTLGQHIVQVRSVNNCGQSSLRELTVNVVESLSVDEPAHANALIVSPNPFSDELEIVFNHGSNQYDLQIITLTGQVVHQETMTGNSLTLKSLSKLASGTYFLVIEGDGTRNIKKLIKE